MTTVVRCVCVCVQVLRQLDECLQEAGINRANVTEVRTGAYTMNMMPFSMLFHQQCTQQPMMKYCGHREV